MLLFCSFTEAFLELFGPDMSTNYPKYIADIIVESLPKDLPEEGKIQADNLAKQVTPSKESKLGDWSFPCFSLAKVLKKSPPAIAAELKELFAEDQHFSKVEAAGPYLNFFLDRQQVAKEIIITILQQKFDYGKVLKEEQTIVIDYSSPNIAKPFHIGHLRTTIIGLALHKILKHYGYKVTAVNHLGDWGTQFGFVYAGVKIWGKSENADINELVGLYIDANQLRKRQDEGNLNEGEADLINVNQTARDYFIRLEAGDEEAKEFWKWCLDISLKYLKTVYNRLGVDFDEYLGESFYIPMFPEIKKQLEESGLLENSRGALGIDLTESDDGDLGFARLLTEDGRSLYLTRDIVTADYRVNQQNGDKLLYVVGAPQILHFKQLKAVLKKMKHPAAERIKHIAYGHVPGISTRNLKDDPDSLSLDSLINEAEERALSSYQESNQSADVAKEELESITQAVALAALYFNYLSRTNTKDFHFSWDEALNFQGDTGPYLLYALARLKSIIRKASSEDNQIDISKANYKLLAEENTYEICKLLENFPEILKKVSEDYEPNHLAQYLLNLAKLIAKNYKNLRVIGAESAELAEARLGLFTACQYVLETGIKLLGIPTLNRM